MQNTFRFFGWTTVALLAGLATVSSCSSQTAWRVSTPLPSLVEADKPVAYEHPDLLARTQPALPEHFAGKEMAYIENHIAPTPAAAESARGFVLFSRPITRAVYSRSVPEAHERTERLTAFATPGEYEPLTFSVYALRDIRNLRVELSELRCGESRIGCDRLDLRLVTEWAMRYPRYTSDIWRRVPELLEKVTANSFAAGTCQRYWLTVHTPEDAHPGLYSGCASVFDDISGRAVRLPILFRVLDFRLLRDPAKRYSVYAYDLHHQFPGLEGERLKRAMRTDYSAMQAHGIDMFPTVPLMETHGEQGEPEVAIRNPQAIDAMIAAGFKGPIPLGGGIHHFYQKYVSGGKTGSHWTVDTVPTNDAIYGSIERAFRKLGTEFETRGWPEPIVCPMDEVAASSAEFAARVYAAIRRAGLRTYITKDPDASDAEVYRRLDAVDIWCSQPFSMPYEKAVSDTRYGYWSYPNHNAGEMKDREVMQRGGRMTYGFGLWRSGYTALIPWHWRWTAGSSDPFNYLGGAKQSGCGTRMDESDEVISTVYWACFREGYDDARYLYTLQQAIYDRRDSENPRIRALVAQGQQLLQEIWDAIPAEARYLAHNAWPDDQFEAVRWRIAALTSELLHAAAAKRGTCPSVLADSSRTARQEDPLEAAKLQRALSVLALGGTNSAAWKAVTSEASVEVVANKSASGGRPVLRMTVKVDHKVDGAKTGGPYPVGWPRLIHNFARGQIALDQYDFLVFRVNVDSDRDELADDVTPFIVNFAGHGGGKLDVPLDLGDVQREWRPFRIALRDVLDTVPSGSAALSDLSHIQLVVNEGSYAHGARLCFDFDELALVRLTRPILDRTRCPSSILVPAGRLPLSVTFLGMTAAEEMGCRLQASLLRADGAVLAACDASLSAASGFALDLSGVTAGVHTLSVRLLDRSGQTQSERRQPITAVNGYWYR